MRTSEIKRTTKETDILLKLNLDGDGVNEIDTGVGFLNHMLQLFSVHSNFDLTVKCKGDTDVDDHHTVEDIGICLGQAFNCALKDKKGIARYADRVILMDECACQLAVDIGGRAFLNFETQCFGKVGEFDMELVEEFMRAFAFNSNINLYIKMLKGGNLHHEAESMFKALARVLKDAVKIEGDKIPSSKGVL